MALFRPADDEVGLGVISRLWIDKMNQFRCRGGKAHHGQAGPALYLSSWPSWLIMSHSKGRKSFGRKARGMN